MSMKILATSDWHLGNLFHGNDRLPEHKHFLKWLLEQIAEQKPDALLIAGDIFDNGNPSAAAQTVYYEFLADATQLCPNMQVINSELSERTDGELSDHFDYVMLKVKQEKLTSDDIKELEKLVNEKDAVLCKIQRIIPQLDLSTIQGSQHITSIEDIINRPPLDTLKEAFAIRHNAPMNERQEKMLSDLLTTSSL